MTYNEFKRKWLGKSIDYDGIYGRQCVDLIKQYLNEMSGIKAGAWGNAIDYWYNPNSAILKLYDRIATKTIRQGDIVVLKGINGNPYGHIGIADGNSGIVTVTILEQNGSSGNGSGVGGNAIRTRAIPLWRVIGVLRPKAAKPTTLMPAIGSSIRLQAGINRTTFRAGTTKVAGVIRPTDNSFVYLVRGYDPVYGGRILINSASAGGNGTALALYYTNGNKVEGWSVV